MKIAYIVSAYKQPDQLVRLMNRLDDNGVSFFVHVDKRTDQRIYDRMASGCAHLPNVHFLERHRCTWGDFGHVRATLKGIAALFEKKVPFDYAVLLTGQDYPIKPNEYIRAFFEASRGKSFMAYFSLPTDQWLNGGLERVERWHVRMFNRHYLFPKADGFSIKRRFPPGFQPFGGSSYWCLARDCVEYIYRFVRANTEFVHFFNYVDVPDEIFFQTVLMNSPLAGNVINDDLRYIEWRNDDSGSPSVLGEGDFQTMAGSPKLFARKFDQEVDIKVLERIDHEILGIPERLVAR